MNKKAVADFLGVSIRRVEQFDAQGRLGEKTYQKGKTGKEAHFEKEAVEKLKAELNAPDTAILTIPKEIKIFASQLAEAIVARREELSGEAVRSLSGSSTEAKKEAVRTSEKLLLNVAECCALTGLSKERVYDALDTGKLKGQKDIIGRGWRIKRADLDEFINNL
jgi:excisionase family DNA binding protein